MDRGITEPGENPGRTGHCECGAILNMSYVKGDTTLMKTERETHIESEQCPMAPNDHPEGMKSPKELHRAYILRYRKETDEQLYQHIRDIAAKLGRPPMKSEVPAVDYIKNRLGSWPRILQQAGLKPANERCRRGTEQKEQVKKRTSTKEARFP